MQENEAVHIHANQNEPIDIRSAKLAKQVLDIDFISQNTDIEVDIDQAIKLPFGELESLGVAFASLPKAFRTVTQTIDIPTQGLFRVTDKLGNPLDVSILQSFKDNSGLLASFRDAKKGFSQARLHKVDSLTADVSTVVPYDPGVLFMAAALMEINKKLDAIQETQQEMFVYLKNKDKAELRGDLETLSDILANYRFNWDNAQYKTSKYMLVQSIRNEAEKSIIQHRAQIEGKLGKKELIYLDKNVRTKTGAVRSEFEEYRLAVYLYSFASFLEVMLLENFDPGYLSSIVKRIDKHSIRYRKLYTEAYNLIEREADGSARAVALDGLSRAMVFFGKAVEKTPVGDRTPIDEVFVDAGKGIARLSQGLKHDIMGKLIDASSSDVRPFMDNIENVNRLYNEPVMLLADENAVYILPSSPEIGSNTNDSHGPHAESPRP